MARLTSLTATSILLLALFWPATPYTVTAQPPPAPPPVPGYVTIPATVDVMAGRLASVTIESNGDVRWKMLGDELDSFREYDPDASKIRLRFIAYDTARSRGSRYSDPLIVAQAYLVAYAMKDGKGTEIATCTVTFRRPEPVPPPVPPTPPVPPVPPVPSDPFFSVLQAAWLVESDSAKATQKASLSALYRAAANSLDKYPTMGDWSAAMGAAIRAGGLSVQLKALQRAIGDEFNRTLPRDPAAKLDKSLVGGQLTRMATLLEALK